MNSAEIIETCRCRAGMTRAQLADKGGEEHHEPYTGKDGVNVGR